MKNKYLKRQIIEISFKNRLSHIGSCLTAVDIIDEIYKKKKPDEKFVLSAGHAHLAHLVVMNSLSEISVIEPTDIEHMEHIIKDYGIHCERKAGCDVSTGSLGQGLPIAVGMALADRTKNVYCLISDGELSEGSIWEALRIIKEQNIHNLGIVINANGYGAYKEIPLWIYGNAIEELGFIVDISKYVDLSTEINYLTKKVKQEQVILLWLTDNEQLPFLTGQSAHYHVMSEEDYKQAMEILK